MNYYIQGNAADAEKIKAAFESKGIRVQHCRSYRDDSLIYFSLNKEVLVVTIKALKLFEENPDYKELELPVEPKFKVGDEVYNRFDKSSGHVVIESIDETTYYCDATNFDIVDQDDYELVPKFHYDITNFHVGMPVLVRDYNDDEWNYLLFSHYRKKLSDRFFAGGSPWFQCIPLNDDTKHLLGTTDMCPEEYINW